jgi:hypothetical protein
VFTVLIARSTPFSPEAPLRHGADPEAADANGTSVLAMARSADQPAIVQALVHARDRNRK